MSETSLLYPNRSQLGSLVEPAATFNALWVPSGWSFPTYDGCGAVRERILFNRLAGAKVYLPPYEVQLRVSKALQEIGPLVAEMGAAMVIEDAQRVD